MIKNMLKKENIRILEEPLPWKGAIQYAVQPLIDTGYVEARYVEEIIHNTLEMGPYYVIAKDLAFLHARSDQGVIAKQLAVTVAKNTIHFSDTKSAKLLIVLAAEDSESHMDTLSKLAKIFMDQTKIQDICALNNIEEIYDKFLEVDMEG